MLSPVISLRTQWMGLEVLCFGIVRPFVRAWILPPACRWILVFCYLITTRSAVRSLCRECSVDHCVYSVVAKHFSAASLCGNVSSAGWQVTPCDPIWHVSSCSDVASCELLYSVCITLQALHYYFYLTIVAWSVCLCVCWTWPWAVPKQLNRLRCRVDSRGTHSDWITHSVRYDTRCCFNVCSVSFICRTKPTTKWKTER